MLPPDKKKRKAREKASGVSTHQIAVHMAGINSGNFKSNDHGLPEGGSVAITPEPKRQPASEPGPKFRRARQK